MNALELQEFKDALLKAERLAMLEILQDSENIQDAVIALMRRLLEA